MQALFELFPVILFFGIFKWAEGSPADAASLIGSVITEPSLEQAPILLATGIAILASFLQIAFLKIKGQAIKPMLIISVVIITIFGGLTLYLQNDLFIKWKPTILYWVFAGILLFSRLGKKYYLRKVFGEALQLTDQLWLRYRSWWASFFVAVGVLNLVVIYTCSTDTWVNFKLFGLTALTFIFTIASTFFIMKDIQLRKK